MKKITPVFGPQELFDRDVVKDDTIIVISGEGFFLQFSNIDTALKYTAKKISSICFKVAHRRIEEVPQPKRWTVADQKSGLLPEVGVIVSYHKAKGKTDTEITSTWREGDALEIMKDLDEDLFSVFNQRTETCSNLVIECMSPIETPDEKAARLRNEWCAKALQLDTPEGLRAAIYDALLSGELPPVQAKDGE